MDHMMHKSHALSYDCWDFAKDVWLEETGEDLTKYNLLSLRKYFKSIDTLKDKMAMVLFKRRHKYHVGVWVRGGVIHLHDQLGVRYESLAVASIGFSERTYYIRNENCLSD
jgi:hypothetical protein